MTSTQIEDRYGLKVRQYTRVNLISPVSPETMFVVQDGEHFDLNQVNINKHVPNTKQLVILEFQHCKELRTHQILCCLYPQCGKMFGRWHSFFEHLTVHTKEQPYACQCGKAFN